MPRVMVLFDASFWAHAAWGNAESFVKKQVVGYGASTDIKATHTSAEKGLRAKLEKIIAEFEEEVRLSGGSEDEIEPRVIAAFDGGRGWRKAKYGEYKGKRAPPGEWKAKFLRETAPRLYAEAGFELYWAENEEADDAIASIVAASEPHGWQIRIYSNDLDLHQLASDSTCIFRWDKVRSKYVRLFRADVEADLGFPPERIPLYKAIAGDASDNIPGVAQLGDKAARRICGLFANADELKAGLHRLEAKDRVKLLNAWNSNRTPHLWEELCTVRRDLRVVEKTLS